MKLAVPCFPTLSHKQDDLRKNVIEQIMCVLISFTTFFVTFLILRPERDMISKFTFVLLTQYCAGDKIEKNEMGWACGAYG